VIDFGKGYDTSLRLQTLKGKMNFYLYYCESIKPCYFSSKEVFDMFKNSSQAVNDPAYVHYSNDLSINILDQDNKCHQKEEKLNYNCTMTAILVCVDEVKKTSDCNYKLMSSNNDFPMILTEKYL
jgi:hypothetical protein